MKNLSTEMQGRYATARARTALFGQVMIVLMMVSLAVAFVQFGERMVPTWRGLHLVILAFLVSLEAMATRLRTREMEGRERIIFHLSELVALGVATKILLYLVHGPAQFLRDLPRWQRNFVQEFFTGEYMLTLLFLIVVWFISRAYAGEFEDLYTRESDAVWDELGKLQNALSEIRGRIVSRVFLIGAIIVILAVMTRFDLPEMMGGAGRGVSFIAPVINVLVYFFLALVLLSQTQFSLLRARWLWQRLVISDALTANWLKWAAISVLALIVLVGVLPTNYSIGLLETLRIGLEYLMQALSFLMMVFTLPFTLCLALLSMLGGGAEQVQQTQPASPPFITPPAPAQPQSWLEFLRSLLFWVLFLGIIFFALRYYLMQNAALWKAITSFPLFRWAKSAWKGLARWIRRANRQIGGLVQSGVKRIRQRRPPNPAAAARRAFNLGRMSPRERIIHYYLNVVRLGGERGIERRPSQTPYAYEHQLHDTIPEIDPDLHRLTDTFLEARYSEHPVPPEQSEQANSLWEHIRVVLSRWQRPER